MLVLLLSLGLVFVDQASKVWITNAFSLGESVPVIPGLFSLTYVRNTGAAWGTFGGSTGMLAVLSVAVLLMLIIFRRSFLTDSLVHRIALALMISGIAGNLLDRVRLRYVVDFFDFYWRNHHFAVFNVADSAICVGVGLYLLTALLAPPDKPMK
jgi:signal peptidase II